MNDEQLLQRLSSQLQGELERLDLRGEDDLRRTRRRVGFLRQLPRNRWRRWYVWPALAATLLVIIVTQLLPDGRLAVTVDGQPTAAGTPITGSANTSRRVALAGFGEAWVAPASTVRIFDARQRDVDLVLETGQVSLDVERRGWRWRVLAGPYVVTVHGTRFAVKWAPAAKDFAVHCSRGLVTVQGPELVEPVRLGPGQKYVRGAAESPPAAEPATPVSAAARVAPMDNEAVAEEPPKVRLARTRPPARRPQPLAAAPLPASEPAWQPLAKQGRYGEAMASLDDAAFTHLCETATAPVVVELGHVSRLAGRRERAEQAYRAVRVHEPNSAEAALAAFALGRLAFETSDLPQAARWLETSLAERPHGSFAAQALGRLMEIRRAEGASQQARSLATRYLELHPEGPHAALARQLVGL